MQRRNVLLLALTLAPTLIAGGALADPSARVVSYDGDSALDALAADGHTVVYFYAAWCPECRAMAVELKTRWTSVDPRITLVIADFDKDKDLKQKFGVTYQDTFVLLDKSGKPVKSWNGGGVDGLNAHLAG